MEGKKKPSKWMIAKVMRYRKWEVREENCVWKKRKETPVKEMEGGGRGKKCSRWKRVWMSKTMSTRKEKRTGIRGSEC